jgi:hypothetical protein
LHPNNKLVYAIQKNLVISKLSFNKQHSFISKYEQGKESSNPNPKIQVAVLLDVSNSMDGLIDQAKAQLWNMVSVLGKAQCDGKSPTIEIALYEYGRSNNNITEGYVKQINAFSTDLDQVSKNLFSLSTRGGDEYCGHVMFTSLNDLQWDADTNNYKVIFIAGNESFLQGNIHYTSACLIAKQKKVTVNTIFCGDKNEGIKLNWNLGAECGNGSYTNINTDAKIKDIPTPYDSAIFVLNDKLNQTYIGYGSKGVSAPAQQKQVDDMNKSLAESILVKRAIAKSQKNVYKNEEWDLVDAYVADTTIIKRLNTETLPASLKNKSKKEIEQYIKTKNAERSAIQKNITQLAIKRDAYILAEKTRNNNSNTQPNLQTEIEKIIRSQGKRYNLIIN